MLQKTRLYVTKDSFVCYERIVCIYTKNSFVHYKRLVCILQKTRVHVTKDSVVDKQNNCKISHGSNAFARSFFGTVGIAPRSRRTSSGERRPHKSCECVGKTEFRRAQPLEGPVAHASSTTVLYFAAVLHKAMKKDLLSQKN